MTSSLRDEDMPDLFHGADKASLRAQRSFIAATRARLTLAVLAAVLAVFATDVSQGHVDAVGIGAACAFVGALAVEIWLLADRPEEVWYDGRAVAESAKSLSWRFAVGGTPFPRHEPHALQYFGEQLAELLEDAPNTRIRPSLDNAIPQLIVDLRTQPLAVRREAYREGRIHDQQLWYARRASRNESRARAWKLGLIVVEVLGAVAAVLKAFGFLHADLTSVASTVLGVGVAWLAVRQHDAQARAYSIASHELAIVASRLDEPHNERAWGVAVAEAEEAISREHTMWRAARVAVDLRRPRRIDGT